jgi:predicted cupin superfamily sugar epimerase
MDETVKRIVAKFGLIPHPEGGHFREVYRSALSCRHPGITDSLDDRRSTGTLIYFLLAGAEFSAFHRVRWTDEVWHLYAGGPLELHTIDAADRYAQRVLTTDLEHGEPTGVVPAGVWQAARLARGASWAFGGCTVAPGFDFADFEMPPRQELLAAHTKHAAIVRELTRG